jgi:hypothetical protein
MLIVPLISYSILVTILAAIYYNRLQSLRDPLEAMPDQGNNKGASHSKKSEAPMLMPDPTSPLPDKLKVLLRQSLAIGDLEVTPLRVERRRIRYQWKDKGPSDSGERDSLVLELRLRNISRDVVFKPMDPFFDRPWKSKSRDGMPHTYLSVGARQFFGGQPTPEEHALGLVVVGQNHDQELQPGQEMTTFICTDPDPKADAVKAVDAYKGKEPLLWRVQVRRGLVAVKDEELPATAVVGVQFSREDVQ